MKNIIPSLDSLASIFEHRGFTKVAYTLDTISDSLEKGDGIQSLLTRLKNFSSQYFASHDTFNVLEKKVNHFFKNETDSEIKKQLGRVYTPNKFAFEGFLKKVTILNSNGVAFTQKDIDFLKDLVSLFQDG